MTDTTHFGYRHVNRNEKAGLVADVFHSVAEKYDVMNDLMSLGVHRFWKSYTSLVAQIKEGDQVLDLAGGTGDLSMRFAKKVGCTGRVILSDINASMLSAGRDRIIDYNLFNNVDSVQADAEYLPFPDHYFHLVSIGFGLRNVTDKQKALTEMHRVLKPGGQALILEFSQPCHAVVKKVYDAYSFNILPKLGEWVAQDGDSYRYLAESIRMHPDQDTLKIMMEKAGFEDCCYHNLTAGIVALHKGYKY